MSRLVKGWIAWLLLCWSVATSAVELRFVTQEYDPFVVLNSNEAVSGPAFEIVQAVCRDIKVSCGVDVLPWTRAQVDVQTGKADGIFVISRNAEREKWLSYSPVIMKSEYGFFVKSDRSLEFRELSDIAGYTVGVYGPSNTAKTLESIQEKMRQQRLNSIEIEMRPKDEDGFYKLSVGRVDAVFANRDVGSALVARLGITNVKYVGGYKKAIYHVGFSKEHANAALVMQFNAGVQKLYAEGKIQEILKKHKMQPLEQE